LAKTKIDQERFGFGRNWQQFLRVLDEERIREAERSLREMLRVKDLTGKSFLDVGSGSGLFSLAAMRLGASRVHSLDYDPQSVGCAQELKGRFFPNAAHWTVERGDALDVHYLEELGEFDVVYSWGVLHHTGNLWRAVENVLPLVRSGGQLFIAIYNDAGKKSRQWSRLKKLYNSGVFYRLLLPAVFIPMNVMRGFVTDATKLKSPLTRYRIYKQDRGMSMMRDWIDWIGGWPYEFATADEVANFCKQRGFEMLTCVNRSGWVLGNNEFVFQRVRVTMVKEDRSIAIAI
jgi:SAM-dependent methyltransferase